MNASPADLIAQQTEAVFRELFALPASAFTAGELHWLFHWQDKFRFTASVEYEQRLLDSANGLKAAVLSRLPSASS